MLFVLGTILLGVTFALLLALISFFTTLVRAERSGAPFFPTPLYAIEEAFRMAGLKPDERFYDLGCGTGRVLIIAEKKFKAIATGFELSTFFFVLARMNVALRGAKAKVYLADLYEEDLHPANVLFLFLVPKGLEKLEKKLKKELRPGTRVISYIFPLLFWEPVRTIELPNAKRLYLYKT
ncbi:MAG: N-6 DNA methylase [bacterium]|nr:N-6 DNA methylase [bacterium]